MRIAIITRQFFRAGGGAEGYAVALAQELAARHEVHVFSQRTDQPVAQATYHRLWMIRERPRWLNQWVFALRSWWLTRRGFDVVHSHENTWHGQVQTIHVRPLRLNLFEGLSPVGRWVRWLQVALSPRLLSYVLLEGARFWPTPGRRVVAASDLLRQDCLRSYPHARVQVVTPGVQLPQTHLSSEQARLTLGLPTGVVMLLFVANDYARKGLHTLLESLTHLAASVHLAIVGSRQPIALFQAKVDALGLTHRVHFLGPLDGVSVAYQAADLLVHPTLEDSYAMVVLEAMAHDVPVIVSGLPWCGLAAELTPDQHALVLHDPRDAAELSQRIRHMLSDPQVPSRLRTAGKAFALTHSWTHAALEYEAIYETARTHT